VRFDIFKAVVAKTIGSRNETSCNLVVRHQFFRKNTASIFNAKDFLLNYMTYIQEDCTFIW
jgi:hypothetical protein